MKEAAASKDVAFHGGDTALSGSLGLVAMYHGSRRDRRLMGKS